MRSNYRIVSLVSLLLAGLAAASLCLIAWATPVSPPSSISSVGQLDALALDALRGDPVAGNRLRDFGQAGVDALFRVQPEAPFAGDDAAAQRWQRTLDRVCAQHQCRYSRLFWHTDFSAAVAEAENTGRPILSLRLLGGLDEDRSCANSRFFRKILYSDPAVAAEMRQRFVLHWSSERPVPKLSIDFGDGRRIEGTITGNSVHYVLDPRGRLVDALPGLYGPVLFRERIVALAEVARELGHAETAAFLTARGEHHQKHLSLVPFPVEVDAFDTAASSVAELEPPTALQAAPRATAKMVTEIPVVQALDVAGRIGRRVEMRWGPMASERRADWRLSPISRELLLRAHSDYLRAVGGFDELDEGLMAGRALERFERTIGIDTLRNEYELRPRIHFYLAELTDPATDAEPGIERFNRWVYDELFLTPASDPWLGLWSPTVIAALAPVESTPE
ncbi:MAG: hypothetical protein MPN21_26315 [Thermoanaerobaculia bacterium]|nr:hypothetical protein [Thermoanaerobaculia bacterium]